MLRTRLAKAAAVVTVTLGFAVLAPTTAAVAAAATPPAAATAVTPADFIWQ
jgi:hypothetical protein